MQSPPNKTKNFIDILSESAEPPRARPSRGSLTSSVLALIASLWPGLRGTN